jgi:translation elongation factor EF-1beta
MAASSHRDDEILSNSTVRKLRFLSSPQTDKSEEEPLAHGFKHLRFNIIPGQENSFRSRFEKERFQRDFF